jgi:hypothetical protein
VSSLLTVVQEHLILYLIDIEDREKRAGSQKEEKMKGKGEKRKIKEVLFTSNYHWCRTLPTSTITTTTTAERHEKGGKKRIERRILVLVLVHLNIHEICFKLKSGFRIIHKFPTKPGK